MKSKGKKGKDKKKKAQMEFEQERNQFRALIMANPNYFGNLEESSFTAAQTMKCNTHYEEIGSVGFYPELDRLEAIVYVNQPSGYCGDITSSGTPEFVRFYLSYDNGVTWEDLGLRSFQAFDIPEGTEGKKKLEYAVTLDIDEHTNERICLFENICKVRAILSWNFIPPPDTPDFCPVWGEVHDTYIQIDKLAAFTVGTFFKEAKVQLPGAFEGIIDPEQHVKTLPAKQLTLSERKSLYKDKGIEKHRFALPEMQQFLDQPHKWAGAQLGESQGSIFAELDLDAMELPGILFPTDGNTRYEELEAIGLDPNRNYLEGVIRVKRPTGYMGGLCIGGSREYVAFWGDFNDNGTFETYLGTASVEVYDIQSIPKEGLEYAVFLPVELGQYRQPASAGPRVVKIRAILSWSIPPPPHNPNYVPIWGNREETLIHIMPGQQVEPGTYLPFIETVGGMTITQINPATGLADGPSDWGFTAEESPFGGKVIITGRIEPAPDHSEGAAKLKYRVEVSDGVSRFYLTNPFTQDLSRLSGGVWSIIDDFRQEADDGWYEYQKDTTGDTQTDLPFNILAKWWTGGLTGLWTIRLIVWDTDTDTYYHSNEVAIQLDNEWPQVEIDITSGGGACADFIAGRTISGTYSVTDEYFGKMLFRVLPTEIDGVPSGGSFSSPDPLPAWSSTMPLRRSYAYGVPTTGESGGWTLETDEMQKCGYVIEFKAWDRTIVNSRHKGHSIRDLVGLCLREEGE